MKEFLEQQEKTNETALPMLECHQHVNVQTWVDGGVIIDDTSAESSMDSDSELGVESLIEPEP